MLISKKQIGFVQGRNIHDNIMLAKEGIHAINYNQIKDNTILKIDVSKAYDRIEWKFLEVVMKKMNVNKHSRNIILKYLANCWFIVKINRQNKGFFASSR